MTWNVKWENMAAPANEHDNCNNIDVFKPRIINDNDSDTKHASENRSCMDYVCEVVEREIGGDLKSMRKIKGLLEKLTAENKVLEEQVRQADIVLLEHTYSEIYMYICVV